MWGLDERQLHCYFEKLSLCNLSYLFINIKQDVLRKCNKNPKAKGIHLESEGPVITYLYIF